MGVTAHCSIRPAGLAKAIAKENVVLSDALPCGGTAVGTDTSFPAKTVTSKNGRLVRLRKATPEDKDALANHLADKAGTGSGHKGDVIFLSMYDVYVQHPLICSIWAEEADGAGLPLGMIMVTFASRKESYWHSLRVNEDFRGMGIASLLFKESTQLVLSRQGADSVSRWANVSNNSIMIEWSRRLGLKGPNVYRQFRLQAAPPGTRMQDVLPAGWSYREATHLDAEMICDHCSLKRGNFEVAASEFGSVGLRGFSCSGFCDNLLSKTLASEAWSEVPLNGAGGSNVPRWGTAPLLFNEDQELVGYGYYWTAVHPVNKQNMMFFNYTDGTKAGIKVMLNLLRYVSAEHGITFSMGYLPTVDWLMDHMANEGSESALRGTQTEEWVWAWQSVEFEKM